MGAIDEERVDLTSLKKWLQKGEIREIAIEAGASHAKVTNVLKGKSVNWIIVKLFMDRVRHNQDLVRKAHGLLAIKHPGPLDLRPLKKWLFRGEIEEIAREIGVSTAKASSVISGRGDHIDYYFLRIFLEHIEKNKANYEKLQKAHTWKL